MRQRGADGNSKARSVLAQFERGQSRDHERQDADYSVRGPSSGILSLEKTYDLAPLVLRPAPGKSCIDDQFSDPKGAVEPTRCQCVEDAGCRGAHDKVGATYRILVVELE